RRRFNMQSLSYCVLGRWLQHMPEGTLRHANINAAPEKRFECAVGWIAHYSIGAVFALGFIVLTSAEWLAQPTLLPALLYGIATVVFPFFIMQPSFGLGVAASRAPKPTQARLKSLATHTVFGLGLYVCAVGMRYILRSLPSVAEAQESSGLRSVRLPLELLPDTLALCRLPADAAVPGWAAERSSFLTVSRTADELSIMTVQHAVPASVRCERDYQAIRVRGPLSPNLVGVLLSLVKPLADAGISILAISTYDTDYVFVKTPYLVTALQALRKAGHQITP
ncbi:MAG TPA: DUF2938 family protein, partial [Gemmatimonadales bacterium]|nr:DUF2938 family protein [Gemmatimonadales bacterium]